ncbi:hypothetical protein DAETH_34020 (plasmid) [Deinococcus aetherius]|uniref:DUF4394 domain-containing protein n=1 Tax=Deinococcus aetherius TaxID=200252 RepID=A0ABM8AI55_9DEIO|nr:DUF4394 domain-containing protein [Deinococcus aetherius]BDP43433.1 hypothetical protein DAETH_34020 [Deinococcus aetherius]
MSNSIRVLSLTVLSAALVACTPNLAVPQPSEAPRGRTVYGVSSANQLVRFGSENSGTSLTTRAITGLGGGESIVGIDFGPGPGPSAGLLYAVGSSSRIYTLNPETGTATPVGTAPFTPALSGTFFGVDFNPVPNRMRTHSDAEQNLRLNQETGALAAVDGTLRYVDGDVAAGQNPALVGTAYTNSVAGATSTTLFALDAARDALVIVNPPNEGLLNTVGALGLDISENAGFDITPQGTAFAALTPVGGGASTLYTLDLKTGRASALGAVGDVTLRGIAVAP